MATENLETTILHEHRSIVILRHVLAIINFIAILVGTIVTCYYVQIRGISEDILLCIGIMIAINAIQIALCVTDFMLKFFFGRYYKWLVASSYLAGLAWLIVVIIELVLSSITLGDIRIDLTVIALIQILTAIIAYVIWPYLDYKALQKMISPKVRDDSARKIRTARMGVARYVAICLVVALLQGGMFFAYKLPPKVYDIFADSRAIEYRLSADGESYIVVGVYKGTSSYVNIPAYYNNKPVVKIASGAFDDSSFLERYKIKEIEIGTLTTDENGNEILESRITSIEKGAIVNDSIETLSLPQSIVSIENGAIQSSSLKNIYYQSKANFSYSYLNCASLNSITFEGEDVGNIVSLTGMPNSVTINVNKDIYNTYRENNLEYISSLRPILPEDEFVVDFYTDSDYYIESIFCKIGQEVTLSYSDLKNDNYANQTAPSVDTLAYIKNNHETGTNGTKESSAFRGWYLDKSFTQECRFTENNTVSFTSNTALYAKWIDEYKASLNWGTFIPDNQVREMHWTDEDLVSFPVITGRQGYSAGIQWFVGETNSQILSSEGVSKDIALNGKWILDAPVIDINPRAGLSTDTTFVVATDKNAVSYTYDELQTLYMDAETAHALQGSSYNGVNFGYSTTWTKVGDSSYYKTESTTRLNTVPQSGEYVLTVTARSPYGETSSSETRINVNIAKKAIQMGTVEFNNYVGEYTSYKHSVSYEGAPVSERLKTDYYYYNENEELVATNVGVKDAGNYKVKALFQKNDPNEAVNYETKELTIDLVINPHELTYVGWNGGNFTYNSAEQKVTLSVSGVYASDRVELIYEGHAETDAGEYVAKVIGVDNPNYSVSEIDKANNCIYEWKISPKQVTVKEWKLDGSVTSSFAIDYNGQEHVLEAVMDGVMNSDLGNVEFLYDENANKTTATNANVYTAKIIGVNSDNYVLNGESERQWEIKKKAISVEFVTENNLIYNSKGQGVKAYVSGVVESDYQILNNESFMYDGKSTTVTVGSVEKSENGVIIPFTSVNASTYTATISAVNTASDIGLNYTLQEAKSVDFTISPKQVSVANVNTYKYNGKNQKLTLAVSGITAEDIDSVSFEQFTTSNLTTGYQDNQKYILELTAKNAGNYAVSVTAFENDNYTLVNYSGNITINKKELSATWFITNNATQESEELFNNYAYEYNFYGYNVYAQIGGVVEGETVKVDYVNNDVKNANTYTSSLTLPASYVNYTLDNSSINWKITPYQVDFAWSFNDEEWKGTGTPEFVYSAKTIQVAPIYTLLGTDEITITYASTGSDLSAKNAKSDYYNVKVSGLNNANYTIGSNSQLRYKINPKLVDVTWSDTGARTYNAEYVGPTFTISGLIDSDRIVNTKVNGSSIAFDVASTNSNTKYNLSTKKVIIDAGTYTCQVDAIYTSGSIKDNNYEVEGNNCRYVINKAQVEIGDWKYSNNGSTPVKYTALTKLIYNTKQYELTNEIVSGVLYRSGVLDDVKLSLTGNKEKDSYANKFTAQASLIGAQSGNYVIKENTSFEWGILPKPITVVWEVNNFTYNGSNQYQTAQVVSGATSDDDNKVYASDFDFNPLVLSYTNNYKKNAGTYTAEVTSIDNSNYCLASTQTTTWEIKPKTIDVTWNNTTLTYNGYAQSPYAYYSGESLSYNYTVGENIDVGTYTISIDSVNGNNYVVSEASKSTTYEISPLTATITWGFDSNTANAQNYTYDGTTRTVNAYVSNLRRSSDVVRLTYTNPTNNATNRKITNAGTYEFTVIGLDNPNYVLGTSNVTKTITVNQRAITLTWKFDGDSGEALNSYVYDGTTRTINAYVSNVATGDTVSLTYAAPYSTSRGIRDCGTYKFEVNGVNNSNYKLGTSTSKTVDITQRPMQFEWYYGTNKAENFTYDGTTKTISAKATNLVSGDDVTLNYNTTNRTLRNATAGATHTFSVTELTGEDAGNYNLTHSTKDKTITIAQRTMEFKWYYGTKEAQNFTYDGTTKTISAKATNLVSGDDVTLSYNKTDMTLCNATSYSFSVTGLTGEDAGNYNLSPSTKDKTITVEKQQIVVTWSGNSNSITYDGKSHTLTATAKGAINTNTVVQIKYTTSNTFTSVGDYSTTITVDDNNFTTEGCNNLTATLKIVPAVVKVEWAPQREFEYNGSTHSLTATVTGVNNESVAFSYVNNSLLAVGSTTVTLTLNNTNYTLPTDGSASATIVVNPKVLYVTWTLDGAQITSNEAVVKYDGKDHKLIPTVKDKSGNDLTSIGIVDAKTLSLRNVGRLSTEVKINSSYTKNYCFNSTSGITDVTLSVTPATVTITWSENTFVYDGGYKFLDATIYGSDGTTLTSGSSGDYIYENGNYLNYVGSKEVKIVLRNSNYTLEGCTGSPTATLTIIDIPDDDDSTLE